MKTTLRLLVAAMGAALLVQPVLAQTPQRKDERPATPNEITIVPLKHSVASEVAQVIGQLFGDQQRGGTTMVTADMHTNSVIVSAQPNRIAEIKEVIAKLDAPAARNEAPGKQLRVFSLRNVQTDKSLQDAVKLAMESGSRGGKAAFDAVRNQVIVSGDEATLDVVQALLAKIDQSIKIPPAANYQVRVVWLVRSPNAEEFLPPPDDLKDVLPALAKIGIEKPRLAAQTIVNVTPDTQFRADGTVKLGEQCKFSVSGVYQDRTHAPSLNLAIRATETTNFEICNVSTEINAPVGHMVVLGVTPTRSLTSVFVVQVLQRETQGK